MSEEYKNIAEFNINGNKMVLVKNEKSACFMTMEDWRWVYGCHHPERWRNKKKVAA